MELMMRYNNDAIKGQQQLSSAKYSIRVSLDTIMVGVLRSQWSIAGSELVYHWCHLAPWFTRRSSGTCFHRMSTYNSTINSSHRRVDT